MGFPIDYPNFQVAGIARYDGTGAVFKLTDTPAFGVALPADPQSANPAGSGSVPADTRTVRGVDFAISATGIFATYDGTTAPTAANGFPQDAESWRSVVRSDLANFQFWIPNGVKLYVRYYWGHM